MLDDDIQRIADLMVLSILRQSINDFRSDELKAKNSFYYQDAKAFLFDGKRLERFLDKYEMLGKINCRMLRKGICNRSLKIMEAENEL